MEKRDQQVDSVAKPLAPSRDNLGGEKIRHGEDESGHMYAERLRARGPTGVRRAEVH